jgi:hypothetical protein
MAMAASSEWDTSTKAIINRKLSGLSAIYLYKSAAEGKKELDELRAMISSATNQKEISAVDAELMIWNVNQLDYHICMRTVWNYTEALAIRTARLTNPPPYKSLYEEKDAYEAKRAEKIWQYNRRQRKDDN